MAEFSWYYINYCSTQLYALCYQKEVPDSLGQFDRNRLLSLTNKVLYVPETITASGERSGSASLAYDISKA